MRRSTLSELDYTIVFAVIAIIALGVLFLHSASVYKASLLGKDFTSIQIVWTAIGLALALLSLGINYNLIIAAAYILYTIFLLFLVGVLASGELHLGARRWLEIGPFNFQPSEFMKLVFIIALARFLGNRKGRLNRMRDLAGPLILTALPVVLLLRQPNLGMAILFCIIALLMLYAAGAALKNIGIILAAGIASIPIGWQFLLKDYQKDRILVFINPNIDPLGAGYTVMQSKIALGSGGIIGKGWLSGTQNLLNFLPERHTDFIFSVVGEEWGFLGALVFLSLYLIIIIRGLGIAGETNDMAGKLAAIGIVGALSAQVIINVAMTMGFMPVVGLPLPLVSYGGSSLISTLVSVAILLNIKINRTVF